MNTEPVVKFIRDRRIPAIALILLIMTITISYGLWGFDREDVPGAEGNYNMRIARTIEESGMSWQVIGAGAEDKLADSGELQGVNLLTILLSFAKGNTTLIKLLNVFIVIAAMLLSYVLMRKSGMPLFESNTAIILAIASPAAIFFSMDISHIVLFTALTLAACIFIKSGHRTALAIVSLLIPSFGVAYSIIFIMLVALYATSMEKPRALKYALFPLLASGILLVYSGISFSVFRTISPSIQSLLENSIAELGAMSGFGIMTLVLALIGIIVAFVERNLQIYVLGVMLAVGSMALVDIRLIFMLNLMLSAYGAYGFSVLIKRKWYSEDLKKLTVLVIVCGLLFTQLSYLPRVSEIEPRREVADALRWMAELDEGVVLSEPGYSSFIQNIARKPTLINHFDYAPEIRSDIHEIFKSRELDRTMGLLRKHEVDYILIDSKMQRRIWLHPEDGLLFLFRDMDHFRKIFDDEEGTMIYEVLYE